MANYIGIEPRSNSNLRDYFSGTGAQTVFTLSSNPGGANGVIVAVSGLLQKPGVSYFVSGKTLTFSEAPPVPLSGEPNNIEVIYLQRMGAAPSVNWKLPPIANGTGTDAITATYTPANPSLTTNLLLYVVLSGVNATTGVTFSPDGLTVANVKNFDGTLLQPGALRGTVLLRYTGTEWWLASMAGTNGTIARTAVTGPTVTLDLVNYGSFTYSMTTNTTFNFPGTVPASGAWYVDITMDSVGGYTLTFNAGYNKVYGYYFDALPNAIFRLWLTARGSSIIDVNIERLV